MRQHIVSLDGSKEKVNERNWARISLPSFGNPTCRQMSALHTGNLLHLDFVDIIWICARFMNMYLIGILSSL